MQNVSLIRICVKRQFFGGATRPHWRDTLHMTQEHRCRLSAHTRNIKAKEQFKVDTFAWYTWFTCWHVIVRKFLSPSDKSPTYKTSFQKAQTSSFSRANLYSTVHHQCASTAQSQMKKRYWLRFWGSLLINGRFLLIRTHRHLLGSPLHKALDGPEEASC